MSGSLRFFYRLRPIDGNDQITPTLVVRAPGQSGFRGKAPRLAEAFPREPFEGTGTEFWEADGQVLPRDAFNRCRQEVAYVANDSTEALDRRIREHAEPSNQQTECRCAQTTVQRSASGATHCEWRKQL